MNEIAILCPCLLNYSSLIWHVVQVLLQWSIANGGMDNTAEICTSIIICHIICGRYSVPIEWRRSWYGITVLKKYTGTSIIIFHHFAYMGWGFFFVRRPNQRYFSDMSGGTYTCKRTEEEVWPTVGLQCHRHFVCFLTCPSKHRREATLFYGYSETGLWQRFVPIEWRIKLE